MEYLIGILQRSQVDGSYDGKAAQAGFATSEPYIYEKEVRQWAKPVRYALVNEAGYPFYPQALSVQAADRQRLAPVWRSWSRSCSGPRSTTSPTRPRPTS